MEYTKKEALQRYNKVWAALHRMLSAEEAVSSVKKKLEPLKGTEILLNTRVPEKAEEEQEEKGNDSFIGLPDLNIEGLLTLPLEDTEFLKSSAEKQHTNSSATDKYSGQRTSRLVIDESDESNESDNKSALYDHTLTESEEALSSDQITEDLSEASSKSVDTEAFSNALPENLTEEPPEEKAELDFNPAGIKKVKTTQSFTWK